MLACPTELACQGIPGGPHRHGQRAGQWQSHLLEAQEPDDPDVRFHIAVPPLLVTAHAIPHARISTTETFHAVVTAEQFLEIPSAPPGTVSMSYPDEDFR